MATNRADTLDPALLRPGRLDRKIEFPLPDRRQKRLVFSTITSKMNLSEEVDLEDCILNYTQLYMYTIQLYIHYVRGDPQHTVCCYNDALSTYTTATCKSLKYMGIDSGCG